MNLICFDDLGIILICKHLFWKHACAEAVEEFRCPVRTRYMCLIILTTNVKYPQPVSPPRNKISGAEQSASRESMLDEERWKRGTSKMEMSDPTLSTVLVAPSTLSLPHPEVAPRHHAASNICSLHLFTRSLHQCRGLGRLG